MDWKIKPLSFKWTKCLKQGKKHPISIHAPLFMFTASHAPPVSRTGSARSSEPQVTHDQNTENNNNNQSKFINHLGFRVSSSQSVESDKRCTCFPEGLWRGSASHFTVELLVDCLFNWTGVFNGTSSALFCLVNADEWKLRQTSLSGL